MHTLYGSIESDADTPRKVAEELGGFRGSIAKSGTGSGSVEFHADHPNQSVQRPPVPGRGDHSVRAVVSAVSALLRTRCRAFGGARCGGRCQLHLALGAGLFPRTE